MFYVWIVPCTILRTFVFLTMAYYYFFENCQPILLDCMVMLPFKLAGACAVNFGLTQILIMYQLNKALKESYNDLRFNLTASITTNPLSDSQTSSTMAKLRSVDKRKWQNTIFVIIMALIVILYCTYGGITCSYSINCGQRKECFAKSLELNDNFFYIDGSLYLIIDVALVTIITCNRSLLTKIYSDSNRNR